MKKPSGVILYQGPSMLDGENIVVIATLKSRNEKTGNMVQTWILKDDIDPVTTSKEKLDGTVCGGCPHRQSLGGGCYVNIGQAPLSVYRSFKRGNYPHIHKGVGWDIFEGRFIRFGAYGDPAAVPTIVWQSLAEKASGWTGYTHQMGHPNFDRELLEYCMVSADTPKQAAKAHSKGLRTFRVKVEGSPDLPGEIECLSESKGILCGDCRLCDSATTEGLSIVINVHGSRAKRYTEKFQQANAA